MHQQLKKMSLIGLILMIFTSVFGFANSPSAFYLMGYSAMPFYLFSALFFFIPFALMMAEMGSAYRREEGGDLFLDEPQRRAALCLHWYLYVVCLVRSVDGEYRR